MAKRIVLLHGWGANTKKLKPLASEFVKSGWEPTILPLPGFDAKTPTEVWGVAEYASFASSKIRKKLRGKGYYLFGHSFGGRIAIDIAASQQKELLGIILCATGGISRGNPVKRMIFLALSKVGKTFLENTALLSFWRKLLYKLAREHDYEKANGVMRDIFKKVITEDSKKKLGNIKVKTLILWGEKDKMTPVRDAFLLKAKLKKSKLRIFKDQGHRLPYEKPEQIAKETTSWTQ